MSQAHVVKTVVSIPDSLFSAADRLAARLGISRSRLYDPRHSFQPGVDNREGQLIRGTRPPD